MSKYEEALLEDLESDDDIDISDAGPDHSPGQGSIEPASSGTNHLSNNSHDPDDELNDNRTTHTTDSGVPDLASNQKFSSSVGNGLSKKPIGSESAILWLLQNHNSTLNVGSRLQQIDAMQPIPVSQLLHVPQLIPEIRQELAQASEDTDYHELLAQMAQLNESADYRFLVALSTLPSIIQQEIAVIYRYVCVHYKVVFPELETLVTSSEAYCSVVLEIGQELAAIRDHEANLKRHVSPEKVLTIVMAALQQQPRLFTLSDSDMKSVADACGACIDLHRFLQEISLYIAGRLAGFAPNVTALVGPITSSQLLMGSGSLHNLAQTPACNLPSLGCGEILVQHSRGSAKNTGYLFYSPILQGLPPEILRLAQRVLAAKVVLSARIDLARASTDGEMGRQYKHQVQEQIDRLLTPPERVKTKALPVPQEQKSKKRAGRRFRKMRERFQMSELRKAQNKVQFAKEEDHVVDGYGEEIGLGISRQSDSVQVNRNTDARMSKAMISRLQQQKGRDTLDSLGGTIVFAPAEKREADENALEWGKMKKRKTS